MGFPSGVEVNKLPINIRDSKDMGLIPGSGRCPGVGIGNALQFPCMKNPIDREAWQATVHGVGKSHITKHAHMQVQ